MAEVKITTEVAHELLCSGRPAANETEQQLLNYYVALTSLPFDTELTLDCLQQMVQQLSDKNIGVTLTAAQHQRLQPILEFANQEADQFVHFMHPILKAIILHFTLVKDELFAEFSPSIASLVFYWQLLHAGYNAMQAISISQQIQRHFTDYQYAFLLIYTDDNDLTYVMMQQLNYLFAAINDFYTEASSVKLPVIIESKKLNLRQQLILTEMQQYPAYQYRIAAMKHRFATTYETARTDLMGLVKNDLAKQEKIGQAFVYSAKTV